MKLNGIEQPRVAVQALNPHSEFGTEEKDEIIPAIEEAKKMGKKLILSVTSHQYVKKLLIDQFSI